MSKKFLILFVLFSFRAHSAAYFQLPQLDPTHLAPLNQTFASTFAFRPVEGASGAGRWSVSLGLTGKLASTSQLVAAFGGTASYLPAGEVFLALETPYAISIEAGYLPTLNFSGTSLGSMGGAVKWNFSRAYSKKPLLNVAVRVLGSVSSVNYVQPLFASTVTVDYRATVYGGQLQLGRSVGWFEPFIGAGYLFYNGTLNGTGAVSLFNGNFPALTTSATQSGGNIWLQGGLVIRIFNFLEISGEYDYLFGASSILIKTGIRV